MADMTLNQVKKLAEQLSPEEQMALIAYLQDQAHYRQLTADERKALLKASILDVPVNKEPSVRRVDWYGDDGR